MTSPTRFYPDKVAQTIKYVRILYVDMSMAWTPPQLAWLKKNQGQVVSGEMIADDEFLPYGAPLVLHAEEYQCV